MTGTATAPPVGPATAAPAVGASAPEVSATDQHGSPFVLSEELSRGAVLLVFFPFAFSGVCTGEMAGLIALQPQLSAAGTRVVGISCDSLFALRAFADQQGLDFPVLSDFWPHGALARAFGVFDAVRGCAVRGSFLVDRSGTVRWSVVQPVGPGRDLAAHAAAALELARS